jgi:hypothetical protein
MSRDSDWSIPRSTAVHFQDAINPATPSARVTRLLRRSLAPGKPVLNAVCRHSAPSSFGPVGKVSLSPRSRTTTTPRASPNPLADMNLFPTGCGPCSAASLLQSGGRTPRGRTQSMTPIVRTTALLLIALHAFPSTSTCRDMQRRTAMRTRHSFR